ncbi:MAG: 2-dehydropantoate 2-reductase, partial [Microbacterium sp.]|nr:2-dehydropantoate 2-reductase [Microbacterium sp.]
LIAVVGPGAIGTTVAAALHQAGRTPLLCGRSARDQLELRHGDDIVTVPGPVQTDPAQVGTVDLVFLAVKATQTDAAAPWLAALCRPDTVVCVLQNGVEQAAAVAPHVPGSPVVPAVVWFPAQPQPDGSVWLRGDARLTLPDVDPARVVQAALRGSSCAVELAADFTTVAWRKLLQNAVAGLMVLTGRRAGMFARDDIAELALAYALECLAVARAEGAALSDEVPREIVSAFQGFPADMGTSILTDREARRPLEWDIRNGVISRLGRRHGIRTPLSDVVVPLLAAASDGPG